MAQKSTNTTLSDSNELLTLLILHYQKSTVFLEETDASINNWNDTWNELIYCVLAGTQVSTNIVKKSYLNLIDSIPEITDFNYIARFPEKYEKEIASVLQKTGYRFYSAKSATIINSARFFQVFIDKYEFFDHIDPIDARKLLTEHVKGIGNKIASHWIRNIGYQMPIIDIHVRRVLCCAGFIDKKYLKPQICESDYQYIEGVVVELANQIDMDVGRLDYILWIHGREYCTRKNCSSCPFGGENV